MNLLQGCDLGVFVYLTTRGIALALIFSFIRTGRRLIHTAKDELANSTTRFQTDRKGVRVIKFQGDLALEARVDPARILNKEADASDGTATLHEGGQVVRQTDILHRSRKQKRVGRDDDAGTLNLPVHNLAIEVDRVHLAVFDNQIVVAETHVDAGWLNGVLVDGIYSQLARLHHPLEGRVG